MPNSLRNKIKHFCYTGELSESERDRLLNALDDTELKQQPCKDCISREDILNAIETWDKFGVNAEQKLIRWQDHYVPYVHLDDVRNAIANMPSVTPKASEQTDTLDRIITQIEQVRDKDKLCEYPYNRCIRIIKEYRTGNSPVSVPAPKRKAAIERQVITTWFTPEEKLPEEDICVLATVTATAGNKRFIRTVLPVFYCKDEGWYELDYGFSEMKVHAWCDLEPYEGD